MRQIPGPSPTIREEDLQDAAAAVRGVVAQRLELVWRTCEPHLEPLQHEDGSWSKPDPRFLEAGIRVLDRMMRLYRLDSPGAHLPEVVASQDAVSAVAEQLREMEQRLGL